MIEITASRGIYPVWNLEESQQNHELLVLSETGAFSRGLNVMICGVLGTGLMKI